MPLPVQCGPCAPHDDSAAVAVCLICFSKECCEHTPVAKLIDTLTEGFGDSAHEVQKDLTLDVLNTMMLLLANLGTDPENRYAVREVRVALKC
jgi:hypothetical protein